MNQKVELPRELLKKAIKFAQEKTGIYRPVKEHRIHIEAFEDCFNSMIELNMIKGEFENGRNNKTKS